MNATSARTPRANYLQRSEPLQSSLAGSALLRRSVFLNSSRSTLLQPRTPHGLQCRAAVSEAQSGEPVTHIVAPGESLYRIASSHGVTVEELLLENPHVEAAKLKPGTVLVIDDGVHYRFSQDEVKAAASKGGIRTNAGELGKLKRGELHVGATQC